MEWVQLMSTTKIVLAASVGFVACLLAAGCSSSSDKKRNSSKAPPLVVCGTTLWDGASGAVLTDAEAETVRVDGVSAGGNVYLKLAADCDTGAQVTIPAGDATLVTAARVEDTNYAAIAIRPIAKSFDLQVTRPGHKGSTIEIRLPG